MNTSISTIIAACRNFLVNWVDLCQRWALTVVVAAGISVVAAAVYVSQTIAITSDTNNMLSSDLPFRKLSREVDRALPGISDELVIVVDGNTPDIIEDATARLVEKLRERPELFGEIFYPEGDSFFRRNGLLYLDQAELDTLSDHLAEAQPFLAALWQDQSLRGLFDMLTLAIQESRKSGSAGGADLGPVLNAVVAVVEAQADRRITTLSWQELMRGGNNDQRRLIVIHPKLDFSTLHPAGEAIDAVRTIAADPALSVGNHVRVRLTGEVALSHEELKSVEDSAGLVNFVALGVAGLLLVLGLQSTRLVVPVLITLLAGLVWTTALALLMVGELNLLSVAFAVLFIGIGVDFGIHFALRYREGMSRVTDGEAALRWTASSVGGPLTLCAVAAAIGFFSFLPTDYRGLAELGLIAGCSMFVALFANVTLLPALLSLAPLPPQPRAEEKTEPQPGGATSSLLRSRIIVVCALVVAVVAATMLPYARFDFDPLHLKDARSESVATLFELMEDPRTSPYAITILARSIDEAQALATRIGKLDTVASTATISDYLPADQGDKLATIASMETFLTPMFMVKPILPPTTTEIKLAWTKLMTALATDDRPGAKRLHAALGRLDSSSEIVLYRLQTGLLSGLPGRLQALRESLSAGPVGVADLPASVRKRIMAADGRTLVSVYPKENLGDAAALRRFVAAVRTVAPEATGAPVQIMESGDAVVRAFWIATTTTLLLLLLLLAVLLRNLRDVFLVFAPLGLAALLTVASMVISGMAFNFANIIALPLLFGLGIANGIQFVYRERLETDTSRLMRTSTPRAVVLSALTTIDSFGSMALSSHQGTASMGVLLGIAISLTLACTLIVLPALMRTIPARRGHMVPKRRTM